MTTSDVMLEAPHVKRKIMKLAVQLLDLERKKYQEHDEDVRAWYRSGGGRDGYRYPVCIHGSDLTTDYDNICGGCEDGYTYFDYERDAREAIDRARRAVKEYFRRVDIAITLQSMGYDKPMPIVHWAEEALEPRNIR